MVSIRDSIARKVLSPLVPPSQRGCSLLVSRSGSFQSPQPLLLMGWISYLRVAPHIVFGFSLFSLLPLFCPVLVDGISLGFPGIFLSAPVARRGLPILPSSQRWCQCEKHGCMSRMTHACGELNLLSRAASEASLRKTLTESRDAVPSECRRRSRACAGGRCEDERPGFVGATSWDGGRCLSP